VRTIHLTKEQQHACEHTAAMPADVTSSATGCRECLELGDTWVHLRICMQCGHVGCCDSSKNRHASRHYRTGGHPVIRSYEPREEWAWCFPDELMV
jgi:uncharacterized UBP type Zn finger protein